MELYRDRKNRNTSKEELLSVLGEGDVSVKCIWNGVNKE